MSFVAFFSLGPESTYIACSCNLSQFYLSGNFHYGMVISQGKSLPLFPLFVSVDTPYLDQSDLSLLNQVAHFWVEHYISYIFYSKQHMQRYMLALLGNSNSGNSLKLQSGFSMTELQFSPLQTVSIEKPLQDHADVLFSCILFHSLHSLALTSLHHDNTTISLKLQHLLL